MNAIVIEHVSLAELPSAWREKLADVGDALLTVRIEQELAAPEKPAGFATDDPAFGIWRDRDDAADVAAYVRKLRSGRYGRDGSRNEP